MDDGETVDVGSPDLRVHYDRHALHVRIDRAAKRNAMRQDMYRGLKRAAILADREADVDILVLTGTDDVFCVGGDMAGNSIDDPTLAAEWDPTDHFPFRHLERCSAVVVAVVNGICHAGGLDLVLHADMAIAARSATFRAPELLRGAPDVFMATRLADWVGLGNAKWIMFAMETFGAERARQLGLVQEVVDDEALADATERLLDALRAGAPASRAMIKDDVNRGLRQHDTRVFQRSIMSPEMREGMTRLRREAASGLASLTAARRSRGRPAANRRHPPRGGSGVEAAGVGGAGEPVTVAGHQGVAGPGQPRDRRQAQRPSEKAPSAAHGDERGRDRLGAALPVVAVDQPGRGGDVVLGETDLVEVERLPRGDGEHGTRRSRLDPAGARRAEAAVAVVDEQHRDVILSSPSLLSPESSA